MARKREAELGTRYGPRHPEIQKVRAEVAETESQLAQEIARQVANYATNTSSPNVAKCSYVSR